MSNIFFAIEGISDNWKVNAPPFDFLFLLFGTGMIYCVIVVLLLLICCKYYLFVVCMLIMLY